MRRRRQWAIAAVSVAVIAAAAPTATAAAAKGGGARPPRVVRPGATAGLCTFNFVFEATDGATYVGTAGHCLLNSDPMHPRPGTEEVWAQGSGPPLLDRRSPVDSGDSAVIGEWAYAIWNPDSLAEPAPDPRLPSPADFGLVRLSRHARARPAVCHFGGPTGVNDEVGTSFISAHWYGQGQGVGQVREIRSSVMPARSGVVRELTRSTAFDLTSPVSPGDSGMPILDDHGRALGWLSSGGDGVNPSGTTDVIPVIRLGPAVARAEAALNTTLELRTAKRNPDATPFGEADPDPACS